MARTPPTILIPLNVFLDAFQAVPRAAPWEVVKTAGPGVGEAGATKWLTEERAGDSTELPRPGCDWLVGDEA